MASRLLIYNYSMSSSSQVFQHQNEAVRVLKESFDYVDVITSDSQLENIELINGVSIYFLNWKVHRPFRNTFELFKTTLALLSKNKPDSVFFHMTDVHSALLSPLFRMLKIQTVLWYAHAKLSIWLLMTFPWTNHLVSSTTGSLRINSRKVHYIGQAIDTGLFKFQPHKLDVDNLRLVHIGRIDPSKKIHEMINWAENSKFRSRFRKFVFFGIPTQQSSEYMNYLLALITKKPEEIFFEFAGKVNRNQIPKVLTGFSIFIHMFEGSLDKSILEATSLGVPVITLNQEYLSEFGRWGKHGELSLDSELEAFLNLNEEERGNEVKRRYEVLAQRHSIGTWSKNIRTFLSTNLENEP